MTDTFTIYLGAISPNDIRRARESAPSYRFGATWTPQKMTHHDWPYIIDNGVWSAWANDETWSEDGWLGMLKEIKQMPKEPEFVVLPDVIGKGEESLQRSKKYVGYAEQHTTALAVQDGMNTENAVREAVDMGCEWIFVGGTAAWKRNTADKYVMTPHDYGLECHVAGPGLPDGLLWAERIGADSVDTTTIARSGSYRHLRTIEEQQRLPV